MSTEDRYIILYDTYGDGLKLINGLDLDLIKESELPDAICVAAQEILGQKGISITEAKINDFLVDQIVICKLSPSSSDHLDRKPYPALKQLTMELKGLVDKWFREWTEDPTISKSPYCHVAQRAQDCILDELEPLHADAVKSIRSCTSEGATWHRSVADRLEAFVDSHRPSDVELALEILATIPCDDEDKRFPTSAQLGIIRKALLSVRKDVK